MTDINILKIVGDIKRVGQAVDRASLTDHEPPPAIPLIVKPGPSALSSLASSSYLPP